MSDCHARLAIYLYLSFILSILFSHLSFYINEKDKHLDFSLLYTVDVLPTDFGVLNSKKNLKLGPMSAPMLDTFK